MRLLIYLAAAVMLMAMGPAPSREATQFVEAWSVYKDRFVASDGRVLDDFNKGISHSEGQGFALRLAVAAGDEATFRRIWKWTKETLQRKDGLFYWKWDPAAQPPITDQNNATDGDLFIAWALLVASERWQEPDFEMEADRIIKALEAHAIVETDQGRVVLLPGRYYFSDETGLTLNLSYYVFPALQDIAAHKGSSVWIDLYQDGLSLLNQSRFGTYGLPGDWQLFSPKGEMTLSPKHEKRFGYEAIRIPLYLIWAGHTDESFIGRYGDFWLTNAVTRRRASWVNLETDELADYDVSPGFEAVRVLTLDTLGHDLGVQSNAAIPAMPVSQDTYYSASLTLLSVLARAEVRGTFAP